jgi:hypothetical protein
MASVRYIGVALWRRTLDRQGESAALNVKKILGGEGLQFERPLATLRC